MTAATLDFTIEQGATFSRVLTWKDGNGDPVDLTGYSARMQARGTMMAPSTFIDINTSNGGIVLGGSDGTITLTVSASTTDAIGENAGVYDLELESGSGVVTRLLQGNVAISKSVTRS